MARLEEERALKLIETLNALSGALPSVHAEWESERQQRVTAAIARLDSLKKRLPTTVGGTNAVPWNALSPEEVESLSIELRAVRTALLGLLDGEGPVEPENHPMRLAFASPSAIYFLVVVGLVGSITTLSQVLCHWSSATGETAVEATPAPAGSASAQASGSSSAAPTVPASMPVPPPSASDASVPGSSAAAGAPTRPLSPSAEPSSSPPASASAPVADGAPRVTTEKPVDAGSPSGAPSASTAASARTAPSASAAPPAPTGSAKPASSADNADLIAAVGKVKDAVETLKGVKGVIKEHDVLRMIILMGLLGGFLRLTSSMAKYVGNRALLRSWIVYYLLMPVVAASLAPMVYLLLRVGVLNAGASDTADATAHLNVFGLYAFAGLTGLFAEQAMGMLKDIFTRIFGGVEGTDSLHKGPQK